MPERTQYAPGTPSWVDLQTSDQAGAKSFYGALFGWEYDDQPVGHDADGNEVFYSMATKNGKHVAAIAPLADARRSAALEHLRDGCRRRRDGGAGCRARAAR